MKLKLSSINNILRLFGIVLVIGNVPESTEKERKPLTLSIDLLSKWRIE
jgi:hypothetical protein